MRVDEMGIPAWSRVKGTSITLKRGTMVKNIRLTDDEEEFECNVEKTKGLILKTCILKKA